MHNVHFGPVWRAQRQPDIVEIHKKQAAARTLHRWSNGIMVAQVILTVSQMLYIFMTPETKDDDRFKAGILANVTMVFLAYVFAECSRDLQIDAEQEAARLPPMQGGG